MISFFEDAIMPGGGGASPPGMPIVIDLDRDGIEIVDHTASQVLMDFDRDGYREATAWAGPQDGVLAIDLAADGSAGPDGRLTNVMEVAFARGSRGRQDRPHGPAPRLR